MIGNLFITLASILVVEVVLGLLLEVSDVFYYLLLAIDFATIIVDVLLVFFINVLTKKENHPKLKQFFYFFLGGIILMILGVCFYWSTYFIEFYDPSWISIEFSQLIPDIYYGMLIGAILFEIISWRRLAKFAESIHTSYGDNARRGISAILIAAGNTLVLYVIYLTESVLPYPAYFWRILNIIDIIPPTIYVIGFILLARNISHFASFDDQSYPDKKANGYIDNKFEKVKFTKPQVQFCIKCGAEIDGMECKNCGWQVKKYL